MLKTEIEFLGVLKSNLSRCKVAYDSYISHGKIFLYAKILKECNNSIKELLIQNSYLLPTRQFENAIALLHHIDVWGVIWDEAFKAKKPTLNSIFTFENTVNFPHVEVSNLMEYLDNLNSQAS